MMRRAAAAAELPRAALRAFSSGADDIAAEIAALQRASVAALSAATHAADVSGDGAAASAQPHAPPGLAPPQEPGPEDCCNRGCANCVWEVYVEASAAYAAALKDAAQVALAEERADGTGAV
jgi:hypothetical protein